MRRRGTIEQGGRSIPVTWLDPVAASPIEIAVGGLLVVALGLLGLVWGAGYLSSLVINGEAADLSVGDAAVAIARMGSNRLAWDGAWSPELEASLAGPTWFWVAFAFEVLILSILFWPAWRLLGPRVPDPSSVYVRDLPENNPRTARKKAARTAQAERRAARRPTSAPATDTIDLPPSAPGVDKILVDGADGSRLILGRVGGGQLVATDKHHSVLAIGPTQSGKTSGLALPAIMEWAGPVVVTAAKSDLVSLAWNERAQMGGSTWLFDPTEAMADAGVNHPDLPRIPRGGHGWSPLDAIEAVPMGRDTTELNRRSQQWALARQTARWMVDGSRHTPTSADLPSTWFGAAQQMLAPMLLAAGAHDLPLGQLAEWVDRREVMEISGILNQLGVTEATAAWDGAQQNDAGTRAGSYQVLTAIMYPFGDPKVLAQSNETEIEPDRFFNGEANTLFVLCPPHHQDRLRPLLATLMSEILDEGMSRAAASSSGRLEQPLLVVLDDSVPCAPAGVVDQMASVGAGMGIQLLTMIQDLSQLGQHYGRNRALSLANDHRARVILPGITDAATLDYLNSLIRGNRLVDPGAAPPDDPEAVEPDPVVSRTASWMRTLEDGAAVLVYGNLPPMRIGLRPWFADAGLHERLQPEPPSEREPWWRRWFRPHGQDQDSTGTPGPFNSDANEAESDRYWEAVSETGLLPEARPYDDGLGGTHVP